MYTFTFNGPKTIDKDAWKKSSELYMTQVILLLTN